MDWMRTKASRLMQADYERSSRSGLPRDEAASGEMFMDGSLPEEISFRRLQGEEPSFADEPGIKSAPGEALSRRGRELDSVADAERAPESVSQSVPSGKRSETEARADGALRKNDAFMEGSAVGAYDREAYLAGRRAAYGQAQTGGRGTHPLSRQGQEARAFSASETARREYGGRYDAVSPHGGHEVSRSASVFRAGDKARPAASIPRHYAKTELRSQRYGGLRHTLGDALDLDLNFDLADSRRLNFPLILIVAAMLCFGLVMLYSASMTRGFSNSGNPAEFVQRQLLFTGLGVAAMTLFSWMNVRRLDKVFWGIIYYFVTLFLLLIVLVPSIGRLVNGQRRWLSIPGTPITFQPSEIAKVGVIFCLAVYYGEIKRRRDAGGFQTKYPHRQKWLDGFLDIVFPFGIVMSWCLPISFQSHMSAVGIMLFMTLIVFLLNAIPLRSWIFGGTQLLALLLVLVFAVYAFLPFLPKNFSRRWDHLAQRINIFTESSEATEGDIYQTEQAEIAIGSGGMFGLGLGQGRQKYNYLPENHNDYIFSSLVEELGFVGGFTVIALFIALLAVGLGISMRTRDRYGLTLAGGFTILLCTQAVLSVAVNVGTFPPTGISLPFFSYGGSANSIFLTMVGMLLSISRYNRKTAEELAARREKQLRAEEQKARRAYAAAPSLSRTGGRRGGEPSSRTQLRP